MIPKECKRLAEVDFPIAVVSKHAAREKTIRYGHPSTLHLWWARRPLAACRAILMALLLPDPCDPHCPAEFKKEARRLLLKTRSNIDGDDLGLQQAILKFIGDFANWDLSADIAYLEAARGLIKAAHAEETPLVVDPFAGGGSIPLEALRLGCDAFASDLNPVACLILKVMLEDIPRYGAELADELRRAGTEIKQRAQQALAKFYPTDADGAHPIAYLWARTVRCESPNCGAEIPLIRSFLIRKKAKCVQALKPAIVRPKAGVPGVTFEIVESTSENGLKGATVSRAKAICLCCNRVLGPDRVRAQIAAQRGASDVIFDETGKRIGGARLLAVSTLRDGQTGRYTRLPTDADYQAVWKAQQRLKEIEQETLPDDIGATPDEPTPVGGGSGAGRAFSVQKYGMMQWGDLFTARQKVGLATLANITRQTRPDRNDVVALAIGKLVDLSNSLCTWIPERECPSAVFKLGRVKTGWDFPESVLLSDSSGSYSVCVDNLIAGVLASFVPSEHGQVSQLQAQDSSLPDESVAVWFTDPPYYDAIPYSDLADFFLVWLKRTLPGHSLLRDPFDKTNQLSPKLPEAVQDETKKVDGRPKDGQFFEATMAEAFAEGRRVLREDGIGSVVFAHKTTEGWEALLSGMVRGGWTITGSWPIATEMAHRLRARESAALATSVHLICRPRPENAPVGDWGAVLRELPKRVGDWMERLQGEGIRGADMVFACIGPALEIYSRYSKVETADGREVPLAEFLEKVWEVVGRTALQQVLGTAEAKARNGAAGALEEDARLTALFLWTIQATPTDNGNGNGNGDKSDDDDDVEGDQGEDDEEEVTPKRKAKGFSLIYDVVRRFAQPLGIHLEEWEGRVVETEKGVVHLIPVLDRAEQLFGEAGASLAADRIEAQAKRSPQATFDFMVPESAVREIKQRQKGKGKRQKQPADDVSDEALRSHRGATTLDRVHAAMLLQSSGRATALRALLKSEVERGPEFLRLANALSALYPKDSDEKRLLDAMLLAVPR